MKKSANPLRRSSRWKSRLAFTGSLAWGSLLFLPMPLASAQQSSIGDSKAATGGARPPQMNEGFIGRDIPSFDPGSEVASFDGKLWNINNNRFMRARFEKYLNAPEATGEADVAYRETISRILQLLAPGKASSQNIDEAMALLPKASAYRDDANLCRSMADAIHSARTSFKTIEGLKRQNVRLEKQRKDAEWNNRMAAKTSTLDAPASNASDAAIAAHQENVKFQRDAKMSATQRELDDINQTIKNNELRIALLELNTRGHLQALIMQYFATRRFEHVLIANRFYRAIYKDGDNSIDVYKRMVDSMPANKDAGQAKIGAEFDPKVAASAGTLDQDISAGAGAGAGSDRGTTVNVYNGAPRTRTGSAFSASGGKFGLQNFSVESLTGGAAAAAQTVSKLVSSLSQIDSLASEAIRDVNEGVDAYKFLLEQGELNSATERLAETFALGEYMPSVRLLPREDKRRAIEYTRTGNELLAALEVNDLSRAEKLVEQMASMASDFDVSKPLAKIETAKTISAMHLAKAKNAAISGDRAAMEAELRAATEIWPRNPALAEVGKNIFKQTDVQQQTINELDQLLNQRDHRTIYEQSAKFIAAVSLDPERQAKLKVVLEQMAGIQAALMRTREIQSRGDTVGAWESIQEASAEYPDDSELNRLRADLAGGGAATFVRSLGKGDEMLSRGDYGAAMAWYLDAHRQYPPSKLAQKKIDEVAVLILPDLDK